MELSFPNGLNSGSAVGLLLDEKMLPYWDLKNFDDLPIPFRCVATDLTTGQEHVFSDGSLAQAMRSTMSIPGVFAPVEHGNQVYSDGAAVNNLPVNVARGDGCGDRDRGVSGYGFVRQGEPEFAGRSGGQECGDHDLGQ